MSKAQAVKLCAVVSHIFSIIIADLPLNTEMCVSEGAHCPCVWSLVPDICNIIIAVFSLRTKTRAVSHAWSRKHHITAKFTSHSIIEGSQY